MLPQDVSGDGTLYSNATVIDTKYLLNPLPKFSVSSGISHHKSLKSRKKNHRFANIDRRWEHTMYGGSLGREGDLRVLPGAMPRIPIS